MMNFAEFWEYVGDNLGKPRQVVRKMSFVMIDGHNIVRRTYRNVSETVNVMCDAPKGPEEWLMLLDDLGRITGGVCVKEVLSTEEQPDER